MRERERDILCILRGKARGSQVALTVIGQGYAGERLVSVGREGLQKVDLLPRSIRRPCIKQQEAENLEACV